MQHWPQTCTKGPTSVEDAELKPTFTDVKTAARWLGFTPRTIRRMIRDGELPAAKIRGEHRIPLEALRDIAKGVQ